ncbi:MAG: polyprenol monophosphomannose synthase [Gemmataceae bacterium]|nr:polyprenol monophosphomannose synthase [Gemmataceae bacterium]MDW8264181.1 polyprenol monophosphomannose synthase [Gemmataceae bacterium]
MENAAAAPPRVLISVATYNERENLARLVQEIHAHVPAADVLIIDDDSPDGTGQLAEDMAQADRRLRVVRRPRKLGLGTAILAGMQYAIDHGYDLFVNMDADFSHHPRYLPALLEGMKRHDVMIGSRYVPGGGTVNWPWSRRLMSAGVNLVSRILMRLPARDTSGGFRCYRVAKLRQIDRSTVLSRGYSFQEEFLYRCHRAGCKIGETPILFEDRRAGASKAGLREAVRSLAVIFGLGLMIFFGLEKPKG